MKTLVKLHQYLVTLFVLALLGTGMQFVAGKAHAQPAWMPNPPKALPGTKCDADPKWMRVWHMRKLLHKRDKTLREGIRTKKFSLKRCITCHAVKDESGQYLKVSDKRHFCRVCHDYAAVHIDCFDCHASRPEANIDRGAWLKGERHGKMSNMSPAPLSFPMKGDERTIASLQNYLAGEKK